MIRTYRRFLVSSEATSADLWGTVTDRFQGGSR